jgi:hypothetical protein
MSGTYAILLHYEALFQLDQLLPKIIHIAPRFRVLVDFAANFMAHVVEIGCLLSVISLPYSSPLWADLLASFQAIGFY